MTLFTPVLITSWIICKRHRPSDYAIERDIREILGDVVHLLHENERVGTSKEGAGEEGYSD